MNKEQLIKTILELLSHFTDMKCRVIIPLPNINDRLHYIYNVEGRIVNVDSIPSLQLYKDLSVATLEDIIEKITEYGKEF